MASLTAIVRALNAHASRTSAGFYGTHIGGRYMQARSKDGSLELRSVHTGEWERMTSLHDVGFHDHNGRDIPLPALDIARRTLHLFDSTHDAYGACQCDERIKAGDTLIIERERVVGVAQTWPFAVTPEAGELHSMAPGVSDDDFARSSARYSSKPAEEAQAIMQGIAKAREAARNLGFL